MASEPYGMTQEQIDNIAQRCHSYEADDYTLKWGKQTSKYRNSVRKSVRSMLRALEHDGFKLAGRSPPPVAPVSPEPAGEPFQNRVKPWMLACFGEEISNDKLERCDRFIEEALELVQSIGYSPDRARALVDYVFNREIGEPHQEVGGVMVTLAALCLASDLDMAKAGEDELARIWTKVEKIRAKQAAKPTGSALPVAVSPDATGKCGELEGIVLAGWPKLCLYSQAEELLAAERARAAEKDRLRFEGDLDKWMKIIGAGITGYQPEAYALMDLACHELVKLRSDISAIAGHVDCEADSDSILHIIREVEANNAALTARVKAETELREDHQQRNKELEAKLAAAEKIAFEHGYVLACCNIINLHDEPTIAHDTLSELGVTRAAVKDMNLSEYDLKALRKIERDRSRSPYAKANRKARAVLGGKTS